MSTLPPEEVAYQMAHLDESKDTLIIAVSSVLIAVTTFVVILRFVARLSRKLPLEADDYFAIVSWVFTVPLSAINVAAIQWGLGRHLLANDPTQAWRVIQAGVFFTLDYTIVHWWIKGSILLFYKRVFTLRITWFKWAVIGMAVYTTCWTISSFFVTLFQCWPVGFLWLQLNPTIQPPVEGRCTINNARAALATSALNSLGDIIIFALPIAMLWSLHLNKQRKISLIAVFATGAFAIAAGILRLSNSYLSVRPGADTTWIVADIFLWTAAEASVGLICACLPIIGPLFGLMKDHIKSYLSRQSLSSQPGEHGIMLSDRYNHKSAPRPETNSSQGSSAQIKQNVIVAEPDAIVRTDEFAVESK